MFKAMGYKLQPKRIRRKEADRRKLHEQVEKQRRVNQEKYHIALREWANRNSCYSGQIDATLQEELMRNRRFAWRKFDKSPSTRRFWRHSLSANQRNLSTPRDIRNNTHIGGYSQAQHPENIYRPASSGDKYFTITRNEIRRVYISPGMPLSETSDSHSEINAPSPTPCLKMPEFEPLMADLLKAIYNGSSPDCNFMGHDEFLNSLGTLQEATEIIIKKSMLQIELELLAVQGKILTPKLFIQLQESQSLRGPWPQAGGYVDGVCDDRDPNYIRFYVGQSRRIVNRIAEDHAGEIRNACLTTLHYFVLARGNGHRVARFLRLWTAPVNTATDTTAQLLCDFIQSALEMTFCRAFESLPGSVLKEFFGPANYSNVGLNNLLPLLNGSNIPAFMRLKYLRHLEDSPDADIHEFPMVRRQQTTEERNANRCAATLVKINYIEAFSVLTKRIGLVTPHLKDQSPGVSTGDQFYKSFQTKFENLNAAAIQALKCKSLTPPRGNFGAKIGIVLSTDYGNGRIHRNTYNRLLDDFGLKQSNSLLWNSSFQEAHSGESLALPQTAIQSQMTDLNHFLIMRSDILVVVLCGQVAQQDIMSKRITDIENVSLHGPCSLRLRGYRHTLWIVTKLQQVEKVIIACPEPLVASAFRNTINTRQISDVFGLVRTLTGEDIKYRQWENTCFIAAILSQARREKEASICPLSVVTLDPVHRAWLHYRGFTTDALLQKLHDAAGSLTLGILWVTSFLAARSRGYSSTATYRGAYDFDAYERTRSLFENVYGQHLARIIHLQNKTHLRNKTQPLALDLHQRNGATLIPGNVKEDDDGQFEDDPLLEIVSSYIEDNVVQGDCQHPDDIFPCENEDIDAQSQKVDEEALYTVYENLKPQQQQEAPIEPRQHISLRNFDQYAEALMSDSGVTVKPSLRHTKNNRKRNWRIQTFYSLVSFIAHVDEGLGVTQPVFALRASLAPPGSCHPHCIYPTLHGCRDDDPCIRLALQYRLLGENGATEAQVWKWAEVAETGVRYNADISERIGKANTFVDLLEGKNINELRESGGRRSLRRWGYNKNP